jgi:heterodisulfide reductase subunit A
MQRCPQKCITKYNRGGIVQYIIDYDACLLHSGRECGECVAACAASAITANGKTTTGGFVADAVVVATGHEPFDASHKPRFGYGRLDTVLTGYEAEQILSRQTYLVKPAESIAFIQCVGSRDPKIGRNWCSSVCCAYALRMARMLMHRNKEADVTVYYIDIQNFDKAFTVYRNNLIESGVKFVRAIPFSIEKSQNGRLMMKIEDASGNRSFAEHDVAVLSVGLGPAADSEFVAKMFGLAQDCFGFFGSEGQNLFVTGTCREPQSIMDSIASAKATALEMVQSRI